MRKYFTFLFTFLYCSIFAQVTLNEIVYDPPTGNADGGNTAGEWIELHGTAGTDIGCYIVTDGDWTITIPSGTTIPTDGFFVIGKATYANTPGGNGTTALDLDVETCGCTTGSKVMELTNSGEFVGIYNPAATPSLLDGVIYESPSAGNLPANEGTINSASTTGCSSENIDIAGSAGSYNSTGAGNNVGVARTSDGTGSWVYLDETEVTPNGSNALGLPIELINFEANVIEADVQLKWATGSEYNNAYFLIEHSWDGVTFDEIGRVEGAGTISIQQTYNFLHIDVEKGVHYYRLKQVDFDGKNENSEILAVQTLGKNEIKVYPTVVENSFTIEAGTAFGNTAFFEIFDISGKKIQNGDFYEKDNFLKIDTSNWNQGHYIIQIIQKGQRITRRIIK